MMKFDVIKYKNVILIIESEERKSKCKYCKQGCNYVIILMEFSSNIFLIKCKMINNNKENKNFITF